MQLEQQQQWQQRPRGPRRGEQKWSSYLKLIALLLRSRAECRNKDNQAFYTILQTFGANRWYHQMHHECWFVYKLWFESTPILAPINRNNPMSTSEGLDRGGKSNSNFYKTTFLILFSLLSLTMKFWRIPFLCFYLHLMI